jgi:methionyl-tRNA formyltransferase
MKIVFMGTAEFARVCLEALASAPGIEVAAVVSQPDRPKGRDLRLQPSPVKLAALDLKIPVLQPLKVRDPGFLQTLAVLAPELIVVAAYGQIIPQSALDLPKFGCLNVHGSLLPKYRGAAPVQWAILNDEPATGVTIMKMDAGLDTGDILAEEATPVTPSDDGQTLHDRLARMGAQLLVRTIPSYVAGDLPHRPQPSEGSSYARKIVKEDGLIQWSRPARQLWNQVRALSPRPGAFTTLPGRAKPALLKIWKSSEIQHPATSATPGTLLGPRKDEILVACGQNALRIEELQTEGGRRLSAREFLAGHPLAPGMVLGR